MRRASCGRRRKKERGDFVADVACHLPLQAIANLMGFPDDYREQLIHWSDQMAGSEDPEFGHDSQSASLEILAYAYTAAEERKAHDLGDVTSRLVCPDSSGQMLSSEEFGFFFMILAVAGNETTRQAIAHGMHAFLEHPDQWERWREERPASAVDEILRYSSPAVVLQRTATTDTESAVNPSAPVSASASISRRRTSTRTCSTNHAVSTSGGPRIRT